MNVTYRKVVAVLLVVAVLFGAVSPAAMAQASRAKESHRRQQSKNQWRNLAIGGGAATVFGLLTHNNTVSIVGAAGGLYSLSRYEADRKSQSRTDRARAAAFRRSSFRRNGHTYVRRTVTKNHHKYYQYVRQS